MQVTYAWGRGRHGVLAREDDQDAPIEAPVTVNGDLAGRRVLQLCAGELHTLALWNACSTVNALVALPFAASLPPAYLSPVPPVVLPLALVVTKLVAAQAIKGLATSVGLTPAAWSLLDVIEADGGGDKGLAFAEGGDRHTP